MLQMIAAFRERWEISGDAPLGPRPDQCADRRHHADHQRLSAILNQAARKPPANAAEEFGQLTAARDRHL